MRSPLICMLLVTLTEECMHVKGIDGPDEALALHAMVLGNDAAIDIGA